MMEVSEIMKDHTPEMALTILICRAYLHKASEEELRDFVSDNRIDWIVFEKIITAHQVRPLVYKVLSAHPAVIDSQFLERLRRNCFKIATGNFYKLEELVRLHKLLLDKGIKNVPYKGVILSWFLFGDYISRETADIDFLIDPADFAAVHATLIPEGYSPRYYNPDFEQIFLNTSHELMYSKTGPSGEIKIEIHWAATNQMMDIPMANTDLFQKTDRLTLPGGEVSIFNLENHLLILLVHHGVNDVWRTLRHSFDLSLFLSKYGDKTDWTKFREATIKYKIRHTAEVGLLACHQLFGTAIPEQFAVGTPAKQVLEHLLRFPAMKKRKLNLENLQQQLFLRDSFTDKLRLLGSYVRTGIKPNVRDMEAWPIAKKWYLLYYLIKPYRILFKKRKV
jgi:hypothetical protein